MRLVLVTGAGTSRELGRDGKPLPLMRDWAEHLCGELDSREAGLAGAVGLAAGMDAEEFEETVGALLRWQDMLALNVRFRGLGGDRPGTFFNEVVRADENAAARVERILGAINTSLYDVFGAERIDAEAAIDAYGHLFGVLGKLETLVVVTTNYDPAAEIALAGLNRGPETGFERVPGRAPVLQPEGLVARGRAETSLTPVLHLHGAVGWYEDRGTVREQYQDQPFNETLGRPVVLYPDPHKDPTGDPIVQSMWREFDAALSDATDVVVIGHSLHDPALVAKLAEAAQPGRSRVAVAVYGRPGEPTGEEPVVVEQRESDRILHLVPGQANVLPLRFGPRKTADLSALKTWLERTS